MDRVRFHVKARELYATTETTSVAVGLGVPAFNTLKTSLRVQHRALDVSTDARATPYLSQAPFVSAATRMTDPPEASAFLAPECDERVALASQPLCTLRTDAIRSRVCGLILLIVSSTGCIARVNVSSAAIERVFHSAEKGDVARSALPTMPVSRQSRASSGVRCTIGDALQRYACGARQTVCGSSLATHPCKVQLARLTANPRISVFTALIAAATYDLNISKVPFAHEYGGEDHRNSRIRPESSRASRVPSTLPALATRRKCGS